MKAINIMWDVDYDEDDNLLPTEIEVPEDMEYEDDITNYLSDVTGFCHQGYNLVDEYGEAVIIDGYGRVIRNSKMKTRYYVCGLGYDVNGNITDYEKDYGDFDTYEQAYARFITLQCISRDVLFANARGVNQLLLQLEECKETDKEVNCIDVKNEWWITNPNFKGEGLMVQITEKDFNAIKKELECAYSGLVEYAETLEDTSACSEHLDKIDHILDKYKIEKVEE